MSVKTINKQDRIFTVTTKKIKAIVKMNTNGVRVDLFKKPIVLTDKEAKKLVRDHFKNWFYQ